MLISNVATSPAIPWAVVVMALLLWLIWQYLGGKWRPRSTSEARWLAFMVARRPLSSLSERRDEKWSLARPTIHVLAHWFEGPHGLIIRSWHAHRDKQGRVPARKEDMLF